MVVALTHVLHATPPSVQGGHAQGQFWLRCKHLLTCGVLLSYLRAEEVWRLLQERRGEQHFQGGPACTARG